MGPGARCPSSRHRVEQVRRHGRARVDGRLRLLVRRVGVPDRGDHPVFGEQAYGVEAARQFGGERDHAGPAARRVDQLADLRRVRVAQQFLGVRALAARRDERALEVDAREVALFGQFGEHPGALGEAVHVAGDGRGDEGRGAVQPVGVDAPQDVLDRSRGEGGAAAAVVVDVDEAGHHPVAGQVGHGRVRGGSPGDSVRFRRGGTPSAIRAPSMITRPSCTIPVGSTTRAPHENLARGHRVVTSGESWEWCSGGPGRGARHRGIRRCPRGRRGRSTAVSGR